MIIITDYHSVSMPKDLIEEVSKEVDENKTYRSYTEFIIDATRRRLEEVRRERREQKK